MKNKAVVPSGDLMERKIKLLIVDDSSLVRERIASIIKDNHQIKIVGEAADSIEAMALFSKFLPEIVILDIRLPGENGIEILKKIKNVAERTKVIILTSFPYPQYRVKCLELGAEFFLEKANAFDSLDGAIKSIIKDISLN